MFPTSMAPLQPKRVSWLERDPQPVLGAAAERAAGFGELSGWGEEGEDAAGWAPPSSPLQAQVPGSGPAELVRNWGTLTVVSLRPLG